MLLLSFCFFDLNYQYYCHYLPSSYYYYYFPLFLLAIVVAVHRKIYNVFSSSLLDITSRMHFSISHWIQFGLFDSQSSLPVHILICAHYFSISFFRCVCVFFFIIITFSSSAHPVLVDKLVSISFISSFFPHSTRNYTHFTTAFAVNLMQRDRENIKPNWNSLKM